MTQRRALKDKKPIASEVTSAPPQVDRKHLNKEGRLLSSKDVDTVKSFFDQENAARYSKKELAHPETGEPLLSSSYGIIKTETNDYYAIYLGEQHDTEEHSHILGKGGFGKVKLAQNIDTGEWVALKVMKNKADAEHEYHMLSRVGQALGFVEKAPFMGDEKKEDVTYNIIMKYLPGKQLFSILENDFNNQQFQKMNGYPVEPISAETCFARAMGMAAALSEFHEKKLIHCDFKPENCLHSEEKNEMNLCDFGTIQDLSEIESIRIDGPVGTKEYASSEAYPKIEPPDGRVTVSYGTDIYSLGKSFEDVFGMRSLDSQNETSKLTTELSKDKELEGLVTWMTNSKIDLRPTAADVIEVLQVIQNQHAAEKEKALQSEKARTLQMAKTEEKPKKFSYSSGASMTMFKSEPQKENIPTPINSPPVKKRGNGPT
jgi:serine/threonine protein kinase